MLPLISTACSLDAARTLFLLSYPFFVASARLSMSTLSCMFGILLGSILTRPFLRPYHWATLGSVVVALYWLFFQFLLIMCASGVILASGFVGTRSLPAIRLAASCLDKAR
ncbi:hypothetical protein DFJ73DRAFT_832616 [Zopfochytrium polystomum]|nr:hypothetical protein DFJ73DRAFT_832616 [Zopfochytrium polystomum]